jgi:Methyltransferase domain
MVLAAIFGKPAVGREEFGRWAREERGVDAVHHYHALRACWPYLSTRRQKVLDIGPEPGAWLHTIRRFAGEKHELWACRQGASPDGADPGGPPPGGARLLPAEFDVWSPLADFEAPTGLADKGFTLVTLIHVVDHLYHPEPLLRVLASAMATRGVLVITASNVGRLANLRGLIRGGGLAGDLDALIGRRGKYPRPRVREYCWRELTRAALAAGLTPVRHGFYDDPARREEAEFDEPLRKAVTPMLSEHGQLQSDMILVFRKAGPVSVGLHRMRRGVYPLLREAHAKLEAARRRFRKRS